MFCRESGGFFGAFLFDFSEFGHKCCGVVFVVRVGIRIGVRGVRVGSVGGQWGSGGTGIDSRLALSLVDRLLIIITIIRIQRRRLLQQPPPLRNLLILPLGNQQPTPHILRKRRQPLGFTLLIRCFTLCTGKLRFEVPSTDFTGRSLAWRTELEFCACGKVLLEEGAGTGFGFAADGGCPAAGGRGVSAGYERCWRTYVGLCAFDILVEGPLPSGQKTRVEDDISYSGGDR
jgi:hypothetical protein